MSHHLPLPRWRPGALRGRPPRHPLLLVSQRPDVAARPVPGAESQRKMLGFLGKIMENYGKKLKIQEKITFMG